MLEEYHEMKQVQCMLKKSSSFHLARSVIGFSPANNRRHRTLMNHVLNCPPPPLLNSNVALLLHPHYDSRIFAIQLHLAEGSEVLDLLLECVGAPDATESGELDRGGRAGGNADWARRQRKD